MTLRNSSYTCLRYYTYWTPILDSWPLAFLPPLLAVPQSLCCEYARAAALLVLFFDSLPWWAKPPLLVFVSRKKEGPRSSHHALLARELAFSSPLDSLGRQCGACALSLCLSLGMSLPSVFFLRAAVTTPTATVRTVDRPNTVPYCFLPLPVPWHFLGTLRPRKEIQRLPRGPIASAGCSCGPSCCSGVSMSRRAQ
jgi:hypothetical protein